MPRRKRGDEVVSPRRRPRLLEWRKGFKAVGPDIGIVDGPLEYFTTGLILIWLISKTERHQLLGCGTESAHVSQFEI